MVSRWPCGQCNDQRPGNGQRVPPFYLHHQRVHQPLDDRAERLAETLLVEATAAVWQVAGILLLDGDVILRNVQADGQFKWTEDRDRDERGTEERTND